MRQQLFRWCLIASVVLWFNPQPTTEPTTPTIGRSDQPRTSRQLHRHQLTLEQLPKKWRDLAWCESRHTLHANRNNTYYGLWQIHKGWFKPFNINPATATLSQQFKVAQRVYERQGKDAWTCAKRTHFK